MADAARIAQEAEARLTPLGVAANLAWWNSQVEATEENANRRARAELAWSDALADRALYASVEEARRNGAGGQVRRRLDLLHNLMLRRQVPDALRARIVELETSVDLRFSRHRGVVGGVEVGDTEIKRILRRSDDPRERREAWEASKTVGAEVADDVRQLARLRNEAALSLGHRDWFALSLATDEVDEAKLVATLADCDRVTSEPFARWKADLDERLAARFACVVAELRPWHYSDPFFQEAPPAEVSLDPFYASLDLVALSERYFAAVGFDVRDVIARSDLFERPAKCQHAFCMSMDRGDDVRVLCNLKPTERWMGTMLHELGHAVYDRHLERSLPWLLRAQAHILTTEASAMLFGRLSKSAAWLRTWAGADARELERQAEPVARAVRQQLLVQTRWEMVMVHMERALYGDPEQDLRSLWWDLVERFQWVKRPEGRHAPDWAAKIHFSVAPVYYHNYQLGEMLASQLQDHLLRKVLGGGVDVWERYVRAPEVGTFLRREFYAPGKRFDWRELTRRATGRTLESRPFVDELAGRSPA